MDALFEKWDSSLTQYYYLTKKISNAQIACLFFYFVFFSQKRSLYKDTYIMEIYRAERITSNLSICNSGFSITGEFVLNKHFFSLQPRKFIPHQPKLITAGVSLKQ